MACNFVTSRDAVIWRWGEKTETPGGFASTQRPPPRRVKRVQPTVPPTSTNPEAEKKKKKPGPRSSSEPLPKGQALTIPVA